MYVYIYIQVLSGIIKTPIDAPTPKKIEHQDPTNMPNFLGGLLYTYIIYIYVYTYVYTLLYIDMWCNGNIIGDKHPFPILFLLKPLLGLSQN